MSIEYRVPLPVELRNVGSFECLKSQLLTIDIYGGSLQVDRKFIAVQGLEEKWRDFPEAHNKSLACGGAA